MTAGYTTLTLSRHPRNDEPSTSVTADSMRPDRTDEFVAPPEFNAHVEHHQNFYRSIRESKPSIEDAVFGLRAAGPALLTNASYFEGQACHWDPNKMVRTA